MDTSEVNAPYESERQFLETIRDQYESRGFNFTVNPPRHRLPDFLGGYRPDAIAQRHGENVAIEVKDRNSVLGSRKLHDLSNLFSDHPDWTLKVYYSGSSPGSSLRIARMQSDEVLNYVDRVEKLKQAGEYQAALVMAWALLEATLRSVDEDVRARPLTPGTVVQSLVMGGYLDDALGRQLNGLIELRNRTVHGDITTAISANDVDVLLHAVTGILSPMAPSM
ncbi:MAG: hypothetical protein JWQ22_3311 [Devosia sp.]|nr:hypothetical protein [Devosia sp.]